MTTQQTDMVAEMFPGPEGAKRLERFLGEWVVEGSLTMEGNAAPVAGHWSFVPAAAGWGLRSKFEGMIEGMGRADEDDLVGFDAETGLVHIYSLTNTGNVHDHVGDWTGADTMEFVCETTQGGAPYREVITCDFTSPTSVTFHSTEHIGGELASTFEANLRK